MSIMNWGRPRSLQARQVMAASIGLVAFLALAGVALDRAFLETAENNLYQRMRSFALAYADSDFARDGTFIPPYTPPDPRFERPGSGLYAEVVLADQHWDSASSVGPLLPDGQMLAVGEEVFDGPLAIVELNGEEGQAYRYGRGLIWVGSDEDGQEDEVPYTVYILEDTTALSRQVEVFRAALWRYLGGAGVILLLGQVLILQWSLRPLRRVIWELKRVQRGDASRMSERHPRELEPLAESINAFIESERENLDRQRNTLADLAHSLKTPLAVLRTRLDAEATGDELRRELDTQLQRMTELVSYQLARAASGGHALFSAPVDIEPEAESLVKSLEKVYADKGVLCEFELAEGVQFHGERGDLQELLGNLLENAFKWASSRVLLTARPAECPADRRPGLVLVVEDDGAGIDADKVAAVLQRGVRGDERVHGHGIGLAIVQDIIRAYRGTLDVGRSEELGGARFEVQLPSRL